MKKLTVYLSGATKKVPEEFQNWRQECFDFQTCGLYQDLNFINPIAYFDYKYNKPKTEKQCLDLFMYLVEKSDVLLVNLDHSDTSLGTAHEVEHAFCHGIPIIAFGKNPDTWYNWIKERSSVIFDDLEEAVDYINEYYDVYY